MANPKYFLGISTIFIFSTLISTVAPYSSPRRVHQDFADVIDDFVCQPCAHPLNNAVLKLPESHEPCLHPGQPVLKWPKSSKTKCPLPQNFHSNDITLDMDSELVFSKRRICFFSNEWLISYEFQCNSDEKMAWQRSSLKISHEVRLFSGKLILSIFLKEYNKLVQKKYFLGI